jgi:endonuclease YncB( thermonuclease family)
MLCPFFMPVIGRARARRGAGARAAMMALAVLALAGCGPAEKTQSKHLPSSITDRVQILNGDTLVIDGRHVHLSNASTPQSTLHARCWAEALLASDEIAYVRDLVDHATSIDFKPNGQVDSYNRALGLVTLDGIDLGEELYQHGMAARLTTPRFDWCQPISQQADGAPPISSVVNLGQ